MSNRAKNWTAKNFTGAGAYQNVLADQPTGFSQSIDRRGLMIINKSGVDCLLSVDESPTDANAYTLPTGQVFDFYDQPPVKNLWIKHASGSVVVWEA